MSNQLQITGGAKVRSLEGVITGTSGVLSSVPLGGANGVATLDSGGKVPVSQLPSSVVTYLGTWNAATNTPTLTNGTGDAGDMYICNVAGTVNFGAGPITFSVGDWVLYGSGTWQKSNGQNGTVTSVGLTAGGNALTITNSPITTAGTINIGFAGTGSQYIKGDGTLATFPTTINEAKRLVTEVYNESGATLTKGTVVYINGGHGNLPTITKALATSDATSAQTYGVVQTDITNMNNGYVVVIGSLTDLDTQAYANGTQLYLSSTTAGAWTSVKQYAPAHLVYVGIVTRSHPTQGVVEIKIQNGYELDELHNVSAQTPSNNQGLFYNSSNSLWENKSIATALGYTPANDALVVHLAGSETITGQKTFTTGIIGTTATFTTALDSGYSLQLKNSALNSNGVGFGVDSTYGNVFTTLKDGVAAARNLTLQNQGGYVSIDESGNFGVNILTPKGGVDIYQSTTASLYLHNSASGVSATDGVRLSLNASNANLRNYETGTLTMTSEGNFSVITASTENFRVNALDGSIYQSYVPNAMLKSVSGVLTAAVAGTDYVAPSALSGYVPTSRTLTINGTTYDLSANRSWSVGSVTSVGLSSATTGVTIGSSPITTSGTITLSIATASSTQQGLLSAADWTTFNSKQNAITNPVTGVGSADSVAYWNSASGLTYDSTFYYSSSNKRLGVNTNTPNATIGANIAIDGGYGLLVKNADNNYNGLGIGIDSTYGNLIASQKLGTASARNVTILNQSGYHSLTEAGSFGLNILTPTASPSGVGSVGIDVYGGSNAAGIGFHNVASGVGNTNGAYIYLTNALSLTLRNLEGSIVSSSLGDFSVITNSTENFRVNASDGSLWQSNITSSLLKTNSSGVIVPAVAGTDYQTPITNPVSGTGTATRLAFWSASNTLSSNANLYWDNTNARLGIGTASNISNALTIYSLAEASQLKVVGGAAGIIFTEALSAQNYVSIVGIATVSNNYITNTTAGDMAIANQTSGKSIFFGIGSTEVMRMTSGGLSITGTKSQLTLTGNSSNGAGITLNNLISGVNRRNWGIFTEQNVDGDFVIKRSDTAGGSAYSGTTILSILNTGAATFSGKLNANVALSDTAGTFALAMNGDYAGLRTGTDGSFNVDVYKSGTGYINPFKIASTGAATFSSKLTVNNPPGSFANGITVGGTGTGLMYYASDTGNKSSICFINASNYNYGIIGVVSGTGNSNGDVYSLGYSGTANTTYNSVLNWTSAGNVGIGTNSPSGRLVVASANSGDDQIWLQSTTYTGGYSKLGYNAVTGEFRITQNDGGVGTTFYTGTTATERMRITSGGFLKASNNGTYYSVTSGFHELISNNVGNTTAVISNTSSDPYGLFINLTVDPNNASNYIIKGYSANSGISLYTIFSNGTTAGRSDIRLKKNITNATSKLDSLMKLRVVNYEWKESLNGTKEIGLIAQEVEEVFPNLVITEPVIKTREITKEDGSIIEEKYEDGDSKSIKHSVLPFMLLKALQEANAKIEELSAKVTELENKLK